jgi:hypothetical protein
VLREIAKQIPDWKDQAVHLAQMWMMLAVIEEELAIRVGKIKKETPTP